MKLCSACLLGIKCAWDGKDRKNAKVVSLLKNEILIPVCPEQLGGLPTPRAPQEIQGRSGNEVLDNKCRVINKDGHDVTEEFIQGAYEVLKIMRIFGITEFIAKQYSPSCGCGNIYNGSFTNRKISGEGVTTALLKRNGMLVISAEQL